MGPVGRCRTTPSAVSHDHDAATPGRRTRGGAASVAAVGPPHPHWHRNYWSRPKRGGGSPRSVSGCSSRPRSPLGPLQRPGQDEGGGLPGEQDDRGGADPSGAHPKAVHLESDAVRQRKRGPGRSRTPSTEPGGTPYCVVAAAALADGDQAVAVGTGGCTVAAVVGHVARVGQLCRVQVDPSVRTGGEGSVDAIRLDRQEAALLDGGLDRRTLGAARVRVGLRLRSTPCTANRAPT